MGEPLSSPGRDVESPDGAERFELLYRRLWAALRSGDEGPLGQHEWDLLSHVPAERSVSLTWLAGHLLLPKSTASVQVKNLARLGLVSRRRRPDNERELAICLTAQGKAAVAAHTVLDLAALRQGLETLSPEDSGRLLELLDALVQAAHQNERSGAGRSGSPT